MAANEGSVAMEGTTVLLDINHGDRVAFARLNPSSTLRIGKVKCSLLPLVGNPYGSVFELRNGPTGPSLVRVLPGSREEGGCNGIHGEGGAAPADDGMERDNRSLVDDNTAQKLSADDIDQLRREGASGNEIVEALISNSITFQRKTIFSQEKYKWRKQKKYAPQLVLRRPCARSVCEAYFLKSPHKIGFLRMDMLALILSLANVGAYSEVMIMDMVGGLTMAAVAERLGGSGSICNIYHTAKPPPSDILGLFNINAATSKRIFRASLSELLAAQRMKVENIVPDGVDTVTEQNISSMACSDASLETVSCTNLLCTTTETTTKDGHQSPGGSEAEDSGILDSMHIYGPKKESDGIEFQNEDDDAAKNSSLIGKQETIENDESCRNRKMGVHASTEEISQWLMHGFTSLIIAAPSLDPRSALLQLLPFLSPSSPFVVYHPYLQTVCISCS